MIFGAKSPPNSLLANRTKDPGAGGPSTCRVMMFSCPVTTMSLMSTS